jgi:membrane protease YdiL (CAAX protease family)
MEDNINVDVKLTYQEYKRISLHYLYKKGRHFRTYVYYYATIFIGAFLILLSLQLNNGFRYDLTFFSVLTVLIPVYWIVRKNLDIKENFELHKEKDYITTYTFSKTGVSVKTTGNNLSFLNEFEYAAFSRDI